MKMIDKAMRGVSFLLCLGFLLSANNVWADWTVAPCGTKTISYQDICQNCVKSANECPFLQDCKLLISGYQGDPSNQAAFDKYTETISRLRQQLASEVAKHYYSAECRSGQGASASSGTSSTSSSSANTGACTPISTKKVDADKAQKKNNSDYQDLNEKKDKLGFSCNAAQTTVSDFSTKASAYVAAIKAWNEAMNSVKNACNKYSKIKDEHNKCLCGQKEVNVSSATSAYKAMTDAETARDTALTAAKTAISECKQTNKDSSSADKTADKAEEKALKAFNKLKKEATACNDMEIVDGTCADKYKAMYDNCGDDAKACKKAYNTWQDIQKLQDDYDEKTGKSNSARQAANDAEQAKLDAQCGGTRVWNRSLNRCVVPNATEEDLKACGGDGYVYNGSDPSKKGTCFESQEELNQIRAAEAQQRKQEAQEAQAAAQKAYDECLQQNNGEKSKCTDQFNALADANDVLGVGSAGDFDIDPTIAKETDAARAKPTCTGINKSGDGGFNIFQYLACRITLIVADLRTIVYILAGFGMIAFAYSAIIGKINFKQLANIGIGLFILSMTTALIEEIVYNDGTSKLQYGDFLPNGNHAQYFTSGSSSSSSPQELEQIIQECSNNPTLCPDVDMAALKAAADGKGWSLTDTVDAIRNGLNVLRTGADGILATKDVIEGTIDAAKKFNDALHGTNDYVRAAQRDLDAAREILSQARQNVADKRAALAAAQSEAESKLSTLNQAQTEVDNLQTQRAQHAKELEDMNKYLNKESLLAAAQAKDEEVARLQAQINQLDPNRPAEAAQIAKLKEQMARAEADAKQYRQEYQDLKNKYGNKTEAEIRQAMEDLRKDIIDDDYLLSQANQALNEAKADYNNASNAVAQAQRELEYAKSGEETAQAVVDQAEANYRAAKDGASDFFSNVADATAAAAAMVGNVAVEANILAGTGSAISNNVQDMGSSRAQEAYRGTLNQTYQELLKKCSTSVCSENEKNALANLEQQVRNETTGINNWLNNDGKGGGSTILSGMEQVAELAAGVSDTAARAEAGRNEGAGLGSALGLGDGAQALGAVFGIATGVTEGYDEVKNQQQFGNFDFQSQENKRNQANAAAQQACAARGGVYDDISGTCTVNKPKEGDNTGQAQVQTSSAAGSGGGSGSSQQGWSQAHIDCMTVRQGQWVGDEATGHCTNMKMGANGCNTSAGEVERNGVCVSKEQLAAEQAEAKRKAEEQAEAKRREEQQQAEAKKRECDEKNREDAVWKWNGSECVQDQDMLSRKNDCLQAGCQWLRSACNTFSCTGSGRDAIIQQQKEDSDKVVDDAKTKCQASEGCHWETNIWGGGTCRDASGQYCGPDAEALKNAVGS